MRYCVTGHVVRSFAEAISLNLKSVSGAYQTSIMKSTIRKVKIVRSISCVIKTLYCNFVYFLLNTSIGNKYPLILII